MAAVASRAPSFSPFGGGTGPLSPTRLHQHRSSFEPAPSEPHQDIGEGPSNRPSDGSTSNYLKASLLGNRTSNGTTGELKHGQTVKGKLWAGISASSPIEFERGPKEENLASVKYEPVNKPLQPGQPPPPPFGQGKGVLLSAMGPPGKDDQGEGDGEDEMEVDRPEKEKGRATPLVNGSASSLSGAAPRSPTLKAQPPRSLASWWTRRFAVGPGFRNEGNTCFLNSTLQALVYTPPLALGLLDNGEHYSAQCRLRANGQFCVLCEMHGLIKHVESRGKGGSISPRNIWSNFRKFAPTMRVGRQEDAHEFLRFLVDGMQKGALGGRQPEKVKPAEREANFVYRLFGGRLRSRVTCDGCRSHSDTFDTFLDLSLDIHECANVQQALRKLKKFDRLTGQNKYKCEKCKAFRDARKFFTVDSCPPILTVHLKRFTPGGKKMGRSIEFDDHLDLADAMEKSQAAAADANYQLYAVVSHAGGSNNSGHYYSHIRASEGRWYCFNDDSVTFAPTHSVLGHRNAYILFYAKKRQHADVASTVARMGPTPRCMPEQLGKRKERDDDAMENDRPSSPKHPNINGASASKTNGFIGPLRPSEPKTAQPVVTTEPPHLSSTGLNQLRDQVQKGVAERARQQQERIKQRALYNKLSFTDEEDVGIEVPRDPASFKKKNLINGMKPKAQPRIIRG